MQQQGTVVLVDAQTGRFALRAEDGSYVLAEQLDDRLLLVGDYLSGKMNMIGAETFTKAGEDVPYEVFIVAFGLSLEAVQQELR